MKKISILQDIDVPLSKTERDNMKHPIGTYIDKPEKKVLFSGEDTDEVFNYVEDQVKTDKKGNKTILIVLILIVLVIIGIYMYNNYSTKKEQ